LSTRDFSAGRSPSDNIVRLISKDMIIRGGENVYPAEIENCLIDYPDVQECAVFGLAHERLGEEVAVVIVSKPGRLSS
jgi:acyl-CoA synthetase (AMP-forming)/AMP-acid ligase II